MGESVDAIQAAVDALETDGRIMVSDGVIYNLED
jgi:hypothetical protein